MILYLICYIAIIALSFFIGWLWFKGEMLDWGIKLLNGKMIYEELVFYKRFTGIFKCKWPWEMGKYIKEHE